MYIRDEDLEMLNSPYKSTEEGGRTSHFSAAIKADAPSAEAFAKEIFADLDTRKFGIGWWGGYQHLGDKRRIFLSDYLYQVSVSITINLNEARLHLMQLMYSLEQAEKAIERVAQIDRDGQPKIDFPPRSCAMDELHNKLAALHEAGFLRAIGSVCDCLAGCTIGVLAIPTSIKRASFKDIRNFLKQKVGSGHLPAGHFWESFVSHYDAVLSAAGPKDWIEWALEYRNSIVHRGRRTRFATLTPMPSGVLRPDGYPVLKSKEESLMVRDPVFSDVESWLNFPKRSYLDESSKDSLNGLFTSTRSFVEEISAELLRIWRIRKSNPSVLTQPSNQWDLNKSSSFSFSGFNPGSVRFKADEVRTHSDVIKRMETASVDDRGLMNWSRFS